MARPLRLEFPGAIYHLTGRGNARQKVFFTDADRELSRSLADRDRCRGTFKDHARDPVQLGSATVVVGLCGERVVRHQSASVSGTPQSRCLDGQPIARGLRGGTGQAIRVGAAAFA
jgi:hypothetical protein